MPYKPNDVQVKILGVSGSPRKGVTDYLTQMALEEAAKVPGVTTEFLPLRTKHIEHCIQCESCLKLTPGEKYEHYCRPFHDDMDELMKYWLEFDGYIVASPVYDMNVTPMLNIFFNRFRPLWRCYRGIHQNKVGGSISIGGPPWRPGDDGCHDQQLLPCQRDRCDRRPGGQLLRRLRLVQGQAAQGF